jgi:hypothetical protein
LQAFLINGSLNLTFDEQYITIFRRGESSRQAKPGVLYLFGLCPKTPFPKVRKFRHLPAMLLLSSKKRSATLLARLRSLSWLFGVRIMT